MSISLKNWPRKKIPTALDLQNFPHIRLEGFRVYLRPPRLSDWQNWASIREINRDHLTPFEPKWGKDTTAQDSFNRRLQRQSAHWQTGLSNSFLIFNKADDAVIGGMNINNICRGAAQFASLGYWVAREHEGQGLMSEAMRLTIEHSFNTLKLHRLNASCLPHNTRSKALLERAGFQEEGRAEKYLEINGKWQDHILLGLPVEGWQKP